MRIGTYMHGTAARLIAAFSVLIIMLYIACFSLFIIPCNADPGDGYDAENGNSVRAVLSEWIDDGTSCAAAEDWQPLDECEAEIVSSDGVESSSITSESDSVSAGVYFNEWIPADGYAEAGMSLLIPGSGEFSVTFTVAYDGWENTSRSNIAGGREYYIFASLPDYAGYVAGVSFTVSSVSGGKVTSVLAREVFLSEEDHSRNIDVMSAVNVSDPYGTAGGSVSIECERIMLSEKYLNCDSYAVRLEIENGNGSVTFQAAENGKDFSICGSSVITADRLYYIFSLPRISEESSYRIELAGNTVLSNVRKVEFIGFGKPGVFSENKDIGSVAECEVSSDMTFVTVSGTVTRDTAVEHTKSELCLYEMKMWQNMEEALSGDPISTMKISTSFAFSVPVNPDSAAYTLYIAAIRDKEKVIPLSEPRFPQSVQPEILRNQTGTVSGISCEDAFCAGYDRYVIDISADEMFMDQDSGNSTIFSYDGVQYYPNKSLVSDLDRDTDFLKNAGIEILFRLSLGDGGLDTSSEDNCRSAAAAFAFLERRYTPYGFILGDYIGENDYDFYKMYEYAGSVAALIRIGSSASQGKAVMFAETDASTGGMGYTWFLSKEMTKMPRITWELVISGVLTGERNTEAAAALAVDGGYASQITYAADTTGDAASQAVSELSANSDRPYFINITDGERPAELSGWLDRRSVSVYWDGGQKDTLYLWDFRSSYDSGDFTVPSGKSGIFTGSSQALENFTGMSNCRSIKTTLDDASGVMVAKPDNPLKLVGCPEIRFLFAAESDAPFSLDFIFISGEKRVVFSSDFEGTGVYAPVCDISGTLVSERIDRIAIALNSGGSVKVELATVSATGTQNISDAESTMYITESASPEPIETQAAPPDQVSPIGAKHFIAAMFVAVTAVVFAVLTIKKA